MSASLPPGYRAVHVLIKGRVQGVWYRAWTAEQALALGVEGWVRNLTEGHVEGVFVGPGGAVDGLILACRGGPPLARVDDIECRDLAPADAAGLLNKGFQARSTG